MFLVFSIIHFRESNQILKDFIHNNNLLGELKEKTKDANFSLPIKNPNQLLKRIPDSDSKIDQKLGGYRIRIRIANPTQNCSFLS